MIKDKSWRRADYPNRRPAWQRKRVKDRTLTQIERVLKSLDWDKLATIGKEE